MFQLQGHSFALEAQYVSRQGQVDGLDHGTLISFADLLRSGSSTAVVQWLELRGRSAQPWRLGLQVPAELVELQIDCIHPLPLLLEARCQFSAVQALAWYQGRLVTLLNIEQLHKIAEQVALDCSI
jgi:hypothetical protein